tara:strand:- start:248 stop:937 length:690 start_codon:yes stop_codon:yes gene_type:complete
MSKLNHNPFVTELAQQWSATSKMLEEKFMEARNSTSLEGSVDAIDSIDIKLVNDLICSLDVQDRGITADVIKHPVVASQIPELMESLCTLKEMISGIMDRFNDIKVDPVLDTPEFREEMRERFIVIANHQSWKPQGMECHLALEAAGKNDGYPSAYMTTEKGTPMGQSVYVVKNPDGSEAGKYDSLSNDNAITSAHERINSINAENENTRNEARIAMRKKLHSEDGLSP